MLLLVLVDRSGLTAAGRAHRAPVAGGSAWEGKDTRASRPGRVVLGPQRLRSPAPGGLRAECQILRISTAAGRTSYTLQYGGSNNSRMSRPLRALNATRRARRGYSASDWARSGDSSDTYARSASKLSDAIGMNATQRGAARSG